MPLPPGAMKGVLGMPGGRLRHISATDFFQEVSRTPVWGLPLHKACPWTRAVGGTGECRGGGAPLDRVWGPVLSLSNHASAFRLSAKPVPTQNPSGGFQRGLRPISRGSGGNPQQNTLRAGGWKKNLGSFISPWECAVEVWGPVLSPSDHASVCRLLVQSRCQHSRVPGSSVTRVEGLDEERPPRHP